MPAAFRAATSFGAGQTAGVASVTLTIPVSAVVGDVALVEITTSAVAATITNPAGWLRLSGPDTSATLTTSSLFAREIRAGEPGTVVTFTLSAATRAVATMAVFSGVTLTDVRWWTVSTATESTTITQAPLQGIPAGAMVVCLTGARTSVETSPTIAPAAGFTEAVEAVTNYATGAIEVGSEIGYAINGADGTVGTSAGSSTVAVATTNYTVALRATVTEPSTLGTVTFVGAGAKVEVAGAGVSTGAIPMPAGIQTGDVLVLMYAAAQQTGATNAKVQVNQATGDNAKQETVRTFNITSGTTSISGGFGASIYKAGDTGAILNIPAGQPADACLVAWYEAFRGVDYASLTNFGKTASDCRQSHATAGGTVTPPRTALSKAGGMAVAMVYGHDLVTTTTPAGWTLGKSDQTALGAQATLSAFHRSYTDRNGGASDEPSSTVSGTAAKGGIQFALWPARNAETGTGARVRSNSAGQAYFSDTNIVMHKPLGTVAGDVMVAVVGHDQGGLIADLTAPAGWTFFASSDVAQGQSLGAGAFKIWTRVVDASDAAVTTYSFGKGNGPDAAGGIVTFTGALLDPTRFTYLGNGSQVTDHIAPSILATPGSRLMSVLFTGETTSDYRWHDTPGGMIPQVRFRGNQGGSWVSISAFTEDETAVGQTGTRLAASHWMSGSSTIIAGNDPMLYGSYSLIIPAAFSALLERTGSGTTVFNGGMNQSAGLSLSGSGGLSFGTAVPATSGLLARTGSGSLSLVGKLLQTGTLALSGSGALVFGSALPAVKGTLTLTGSGALLVAGGGGAGNVQLAGAGQLTFGASIPGFVRTLALSGSGSLLLAQTAVAVKGTLARTGAGALTFVQAFMTARGTLARTGSGSLSLSMTSWSTVLQKWNGSAWVQTLVQKWTGAAWVLAAVRRLLAKADLVPGSGPVYSDGAGPAGIYSSPYGRGPTGKSIARMERGPGGIGWGAYLAADLPAPAGPVPVGTWFEVVWWERSSSDVGTQAWQPIDDPAASTVAAAIAYQRRTAWTFRRFTAQALTAWTPGQHRFRVGLFDEPGAFVEISDPQLRIWA